MIFKKINIIESIKLQDKSNHHIKQEKHLLNLTLI